jgi:hypothetical protein
MIYFTVEDFEQESGNPKGDEDKGDDSGNEDKGLTEDESEGEKENDKDNEGRGKNLDKDKGGNGLSKEQTPKTGTDKNQKTPLVRRARLVFERKEGEVLVGNGNTIPQCANLLQAIELNGFGDEEENKSIDGDEESMMLLPEEWVYSETSLLTGKS